MMGKINPFPVKRCSALALVFAVALGFGQVVNRGSVDAFLMEGEVGKAQKLLESYLGSRDLSYTDSVYILKNLGVLYSSSPKRKELGERFFSRLLDLDPFASIHDTYASNTILAGFRKIRKNYQAQKGGKALIPSVAVFDFHGEGIREGDGIAMTQQFIAEMQRLDVFHTLDRSQVIETMEKMRVQPEKCTGKECRLDIARRLTADKLVSVQAGRLDTVFTFTVSYLDVETGEATTTFSKVYTKRPAKLLAEGFGDLANELQNQEAAFLNLSVSPVNTILTIDNSPMAAIASRVPLNPGKHRICGSSPGYETVCKDFEVKRADALTYSLTLPVKAGTQVEASRFDPDDEFDEGDGDGFENREADSKGSYLWWILGSMAVLGVTLALVFNTKD